MKRLWHTAWEPITPRGMAAFAQSSTTRLWLVQFVVAVVVASVVVWVLAGAIFPTIRGAIRRLPDTGDIRGQRLDWRAANPVVLAEGDLLAIIVDLEHAGGARSPADFLVEFGREQVRVRSLLGYVELPYPAGWVIAFNRPELQPKWGAWEVPLLGMIGLGTVVWLLGTWSVLSALYLGPAWLIAYFANRDLRPGAAWRLAGASLMPGAVVMALALALYGLHVLDLVALAVVSVGHVVIGWVFLGLSIAFLPRLEAAEAGGNPFQHRDSS